MLAQLHVCINISNSMQMLANTEVDLRCSDLVNNM